METHTLLDAQRWAEAQFATAELGDRRRTRRAVALAAAIAADPVGSLPRQTQSWGALKGAYRLLHSADVTAEALSLPHWHQTQAQARSLEQGVVLLVQDTTDIDYTSHQATSGLGSIGNGDGRGIMMHSCLAVVPAEQQSQILGLAQQRLWCRQQRSHAGERRTARLKRERESQLWEQTLERIGAAPATGAQWISVGDRASDVFSYLHRARGLGWHVLLRVNQNRRIETPDGQITHLITHMRRLPPQMSTTQHLRARKGIAEQDLTLEISATSVWVEPPWLGAPEAATALKCSCVRCVGTTIEGVDIEWILLTDLPIDERAAIESLISWYEHRWIIEEYHKGLKTGCAIEQRRLQQAAALEALIAICSITAVRLLQLRSMARQQPQRLAVECFSRPMLQLLIARLGLGCTPEQMTLRQCWHAVARLGGFLARTSDGEPGWQTLWHGWQRLEEMLWASMQPRGPT